MVVQILEHLHNLGAARVPSRRPPYTRRPTLKPGPSMQQPSDNAAGSTKPKPPNPKHRPLRHTFEEDVLLNP